MNDAFGYWLSGLIDGEGSFNIPSQSSGPSCSFHLSLRSDDDSTIRMIRHTVGFGSVFIEKASNRNGRDKKNQTRWVTQSANDCRQLSALVSQYPLRSKKRLDFEIWKEAVDIYVNNQTRGNRWHKSSIKPERDEKLYALKRDLEIVRKYVG